MPEHNTEVVGTDEFGNGQYRALYEEIMGDVGKLAAVERSYLVLKPTVPLFIISLKMKARPAAKTLGTVASTRSEKDTVYVSITDELYAPGILAALWNRYGRDNVQQSDRLDISVTGAESSFEVDDIVVESDEQPIQEILGALFRVLPEGIRVRRTFFDGDVVTVVATEERMMPEYLEEGTKVHEDMQKGVE